MRPDDGYGTVRGTVFALTASPAFPGRGTPRLRRATVVAKAAEWGAM
ncbi:MAG: hypothetical protein J6V01_04045 [Clostridia bacterium]|nr:hypothetical protein [Clostridia bacterium]